MRAPLGYRSKKEDGFTIIEVMIVLAVASLIMLVVLLAVPALQRSSRNTSRTADATKVAAAVSECLSNRNNTVASCDANTEITAVLDIASLKQLTGTLTIATTLPASYFPATTDAVSVYYTAKCAADGATAAATTTATQFVVVYNNEGSGGNIARCIST